MGICVADSLMCHTEAALANFKRAWAVQWMDSRRAPRLCLALLDEVCMRAFAGLHLALALSGSKERRDDGRHGLAGVARATTLSL